MWYWNGCTVKLGSHDAWYVFVVCHVRICQKDSSNLTHTVCFDVSNYRLIGEPDVTNELMTHLLKLDTFFHTHDVRIMTHHASWIRTTHCVDPALGCSYHRLIVGGKIRIYTTCIPIMNILAYLAVLDHIFCMLLRNESIE